MTTFIKTKFNKLDEQTNIDNIHTLPANITEYNIISKLDKTYQRHLDSESLTTIHKTAK